MENRVFSARKSVCVCVWMCAIPCICLSSLSLISFPSVCSRAWPDWACVLVNLTGLLFAGLLQSCLCCSLLLPEVLLATRVVFKAAFLQAEEERATFSLRRPRSRGQLAAGPILGHLEEACLLPVSCTLPVSGAEEFCPRVHFLQGS